MNKSQAQAPLQQIQLQEIRDRKKNNRKQIMTKEMKCCSPRRWQRRETDTN